MAAPPEITLRNLSGRFVLNRSLSDDADPILALQGVGWMIRKAAQMINVVIGIKQHQDSDGKWSIRVQQPGVTIQHTIDGKEAVHTDSVFGQVINMSAWKKCSQFDTNNPDEAFLKEGWLDDDVLDMRSRSEKNGWTQRMVWGFQKLRVDHVEQRMHARKLVTTKGAVTKLHTLRFEGIVFLSLILVALAEIYTFPSTPVSGPAIAEFTAASPIDAPKFSQVNGTVWDWWYFDVVAPDLQRSVVITFNLGTVTALLGGNIGTVPYMGIFVSWTDGTTYYNDVVATEAVITVNSDQSTSGSWPGAAASWDAPSGTSVYRLKWESAEINGTVNFVSKAPPHYPCGGLSLGSNLEIFPHVGWANAVPDADASVDMVINGAELKFDGVGYHDKNWGDLFFPAGFHSWFWGHGRFGPYQLVWFDTVKSDGTESLSVYLAKDGEVLLQSCEPGSIQVRPVGQPFPPPDNFQYPNAFTITADVPGIGKLDVTVTASKATLAVPIYYRWIGSVTGSVGGGPTYTGIGLWEDVNPIDVIADLF